MFIDPSNYSHFLLATDYGLLMSQDGGLSYNPINTLVPSGNSIEIFTVNPDNLNEIYFAVSNIIHKSIDGGNSWKTIETLGSRRSVSYILIDEVVADTILIGVSSSK